MRKMIQRLFILIAVPLGMALAPLALAADEEMVVHFDGTRISAAYIYTQRDMVAAMAAHYCRDRYGKKAELGPGACTKMLPLEANRCRAEAHCR